MKTRVDLGPYTGCGVCELRYEVSRLVNPLAADVVAAFGALHDLDASERAAQWAIITRSLDASDPEACDWAEDAARLLLAIVQRERRETAVVGFR